MRSDEFWKWYEDIAAPGLAGSPDRDRSVTFRKMFEHLDKLDRPVTIVETGCMQEPDNWAGNGCSTLLFDKYAQCHPGSKVLSVDIDRKWVDAAKGLVSDATIIMCSDSVAMLKQWAMAQGSFDLLYLDASHHDWTIEIPSQVHHIRELFAAIPGLRPDSMVVVDDTRVGVDDFPQNKVYGKGGLIAEFAFEIGADLEFIGYQIGFTNIAVSGYESVGTKEARTKRIEELIKRARAYMETSGRIGIGQLQADRLYRLIIAWTPPPWTGLERVARGEACAHFARLAIAMNRHGLAMDWYNRALECDPLATDYRLELATKCLVNVGAMKAARRQAIIAKDIDPHNPNAWAALGGVLYDMLDDGDARKAYDTQIKVSKGEPSALLNRACLAIDTEDYDTARDICAKLTGSGNEADAYHIMAVMAHRESRHEESIELFDKALAGGCRKVALTHFNRSQPLQALGRYKEAFADHAWCAHEQTDPALYVPYMRFTLPVWQGEPPPKVLHIHGEAGHGDNIALIRYLPMLVERGYTVRYECDPLLMDIVKRSMPNIKVVRRAKDYPGDLGIKAFDYHLPVGGLPHRFETDIDTVPWRGPYLKADTELAVEYYAPRLPKGRRIGLCWSSGIRTDLNIWMRRYGAKKSMHLSQLWSMFCGSGDIFVSLQIGPEREQIATHGDGIIDLLPEEPSWDDTAALIETLDLVVTVDTGVAHLAGAMGKPTWLMMQKDGASWHFMCERPGFAWNTRSPWYPSIRIFRQHVQGEWDGVVTSVAKALQESADIAA